MEVDANPTISDEVSLLSGDDEPIDASGLIAQKIKEAADQDLIRKTTISVIETQKQLKQERNAENFLLSQVAKAATALTEAVAIGFDADNINTKGVSAQLSTIKGKVQVIEEWLAEVNENQN